MSKQSRRWVITDEHFARDRAELDKIRSTLVLDHNAELEKTAERFREELEEFDRRYDRIDELEAMAERYASTKLGRRKIADVGKPKPAKPKRPTPSRPVPSGPRWTPEEDERLLSDDEAQIDKLALERGVNRSAIEKHLSVLRRRQLNLVDPPAAQAKVETPAQSAASSSETTKIFEPPHPPADWSKLPSPQPAPEDKSEPTSDERAALERPLTLTETERRIARVPPAKPGRPVDGLIDSGRGRERVYDPVAFASRDSR